MHSDTREIHLENYRLRREVREYQALAAEHVARAAEPVILRLSDVLLEAEHAELLDEERGR